MAKKASKRAAKKRVARKAPGKKKVTVDLKVPAKGFYVVDVKRKKPKVQLF
jgi:hypothetical protein